MPSFPTRRSYLGLAFAFILFAVYASLIPFDWRPLSLAEAGRLFAAEIAVWPKRVSRGDVLANILLFVPVGFALTGALVLDRAGRGRVAAAASAVLLASFVASLVAEFVQTFTNDRLTSPVDLISQTIGCIIGIVAWAVVGDALTIWLRRTLASAPQDRLPRALAAYATIWVLVNLAPFDITIDVGDFGQRLRAGRIGLLPPHLPWTRFVWDALAEVLGAIPLGAAGLVAWTPRMPRSTGTAFASGAAVVLGTEVAQMFIRSHSALASDVILGWIGVAIGVRLGQRVLQPAPLAQRFQQPMIWVPALAVLAGWCVVLVVFHWQPYDFVVDSRAVRHKLAELSLVPFAPYMNGRWLNALNDILTKVSLAAPLGAIAAFVVRRDRLTPPVLWIGWAIAFGAVFAIIEAGQFFLPSRIPAPTDVLTGTLGAVGGFALGQWLSSGRHRG